MDDEIETLLVEVRAGTEGFRSDMEAMRSVLDGGLVDGFARAGGVLERGLLQAVRNGGAGFDDLKRIAVQSLNEIAAQAVRIGIGSAGGQQGGLASLLGGALAGLFGLPGRATGGPVSPGRPYLVGERGPELFVPTAAGRIETGGSGAPRDVRVSINLAQPRGVEAPVALRRSARQVASSVRRALGNH